MELSRLKEIIADILSVEEDNINLETSFIDDLGADSLDLFQIITAIEEEAGVEFDIENADNIKTVSDALAEIRRLKN